MAVFLGCSSTGQVGLCFLWLFVQELLKAQPAVVLVLKRLRRRGNGLKSHQTDWEKPGIEPATPGLQDIGLSPTPRRPIKLHEDIMNGYRDRECTRMYIQKQIKIIGGITLKQRNENQPLLYVTHHLDLTLIPLKLHEDIPNGY